MSWFEKNSSFENVRVISYDLQWIDDILGVQEVSHTWKDEVLLGDDLGWTFIDDFLPPLENDSR